MDEIGREYLSRMTIVVILGLRGKSRIRLSVNAVRYPLLQADPITGKWKAWRTSTGCAGTR